MAVAVVVVVVGTEVTAGGGKRQGSTFRSHEPALRVGGLCPTTRRPVIDLESEAEDLLRSLAIGSKGEVYLIGRTAPDDLKVTPGAVQVKREGNSAVFVVKQVPQL
jgi:hypothetical protein